MNKDELLRIYSAYLPYGLKARLNQKGLFDLDLEYPDPSYSRWGTIDNWQVYDNNLTGSIYISNKMSVDFENIDEIDIALYDLSYLAKEELIKAGFDSHIDCLTHERENWIKKEGFEHYVNRIPHGHIQWLLKNHYNVFNLPADQFINKATLSHENK